MYNLIKSITVLISLFGLVKAAPCPCTLQDSTRYPGTLQWNCEGLGLIQMPGGCYDIQSKNVTELICTDNSITEVSTIDLAGMADLKALYIDSNQIVFFDPTALLGIFKVELFHGEHNLNMPFPKIGLKNQPNLKEVHFVGSHIINVPDLTDSPALTKLDARSASLSTLPRPTFATLTSSTFLLNLVGNTIIDVAADILLPLPDGAVINVDSYVTIWAANSTQKTEVLNKNWAINIDLAISLKVCGKDGNPTDATMC